jgi:hypothetical protein
MVVFSRLSTVFVVDNQNNTRVTLRHSIFGGWTTAAQVKAIRGSQYWATGGALRWPNGARRALMVKASVARIARNLSRLRR